jgi:hypothetical protein
MPKVKILLSIPVTGQAQHLAPGTIHEEIAAPKKFAKSTIAGVWVMGTEEPVKLVRGEYERVNE